MTIKNRIQNSMALIIKEKLKAWDVPLNTFEDMDAVFDDMTRFANYLGDEYADEFVEVVLWMIDNQCTTRTEILDFFVGNYSQYYRPSIAAALMNHITAQGPSLLVELLGYTKDPQAMVFIMQTIDLTTAGEELLLPCIHTIGSVGGQEALPILKKILRVRGGWLSKEVLEDLEEIIKLKLETKLNLPPGALPWNWRGAAKKRRSSVKRPRLLGVNNNFLRS